MSAGGAISTLVYVLIIIVVIVVIVLLLKFLFNAFGILAYQGLEQEMIEIQQYTKILLPS